MVTIFLPDNVDWDGALELSCIWLWSNLSSCWDDSDPSDLLIEELIAIDFVDPNDDDKTPEEEATESSLKWEKQRNILIQGKNPCQNWKK